MRSYVAVLFLAAAGAAAALAAPAARTGAPKFAAARFFTAGKGPAQVLLADVTGDGKIDVLTADAKAATVSLLAGDGRGGFAAPRAIAAGPAPHELVAADFDGDRVSDLAVSSHDSPFVQVLRGAGGGRFGAPAAVRAHAGAKAHNHGLVVGDFDRNGAPDLATSNHDAGSVSVLLGNGKGRFAPAPRSPFATGKGPYPLAAGDANADGRIDLLTPDVAAGTVTVLAGDGKGGFAAAAPAVKTLPRPYALALADFNGDGALDAAIAHDDTSMLALSLGVRGALQTPRRFDAGTRVGSLVALDADNDGDLDLAGGSDAGIVLLLNDSSGRFSPAAISPLASGKGGWSIAAADVNGDGRTDLVAACFEENRIAVLLAWKP